MPHIDSNAVLWKETKGKVVILQLSSGEYSELNVVGSAIWKLLSEDANETQIVKTLAERYEADEAKIQNDVQVFFKRMIAQGLLSA